MGFTRRFLYFSIFAYVLISAFVNEVEARRKILKGRKTITRDYIKPPLFPAWLKTIFMGFVFLGVGGLLYAGIRKFVIVSPSTTVYTSDNEVPQNEDRQPLKILITGARNKPVESLVYSIIKGSVFGADQPVVIKLFDLPGKKFEKVIALASEVVLSGFPLVRDIIPTDEPGNLFEDIDVAILLNPEYQMKSKKEKLNYNFQLYKNLGHVLSKNRKDTIKVVIAGEMCNECTMVFAEYAKIPVQNITGLSRHIAARCYNAVIQSVKPKFKNIHGIHIWGMRRPDVANATIEEIKDGATPEATFFKTIGDQTIHMYTAVKDFTAEEKPISEGIQNYKWVKYTMSKNTEFLNTESNDIWIGSSICKHLRDWWNGSERPFSMIVCSDGSYNIPEGLFASFPVKIDYDRKWKIVQNLTLDAHTEEELKKDIKYLSFIKAQIMIYTCKENVKFTLEQKLEAITNNKSK